VRPATVGVLLTLAVLLLGAACDGDGSSDETPGAATGRDGRPLRVLFIGDSFTNSISGAVERFAAAGEPSVVFEGGEITRNGTSLGGLWQSRTARPTIRDGGWTIVVLQEDLAIEGDFDVESFYEHARKFDAEIRDAGAETVMFMPWEYDNSNPVRIGHIASAFSEIGAELGITVAPVGLAWSQSTAERPDLDLYSSDRVHSSGLGIYLTTAVLYASIFDQTPVGNTFWPDGEERPPLADLAFLQRIAWETVEDYRPEAD
jgi:hypothetical protein